MIRRHVLRVLALALVVPVLAACGPDETQPTTGPGTRAKPLVMTTFYPIQYVAERIGGDLVDVRCPLPEDADPIFWQPPREAIAAYQEADLILLNGASFEKWVAHASLPLTRTIDTAAGFSPEFVEYQDAVAHTHGKGGEHAHTGIDGHTWLDPRNLKRQALEVLRGLGELLPEKAADFETRHAELAADLDALDAAFSALGQPAKGMHLYASHPAYNYVARRYGWPVVNLDLDPETMPDDAQLADLATRLAERPGGFILWESAPLAEIAERLQRDHGLTSIEFSPCEMPPPGGADYLTVMRASLQRVRPAFPSAK